MLSGAASPAAVAFAVLTGVLGTSLVQAQDGGQPASPMRVAAISNDAPVVESAAQPSFTIPALPPADIDLRVLLAQGAPILATDGTLRDDTILVAFATSAPENSEDEVAKEHGLELLDRTELSGLGMRIARYRVRDNRPIATVVANLRMDQRVRQAQGNFEYRPIPPSAPATEVGGLKDGPVAKVEPGSRLGGPATARAGRKTVAAVKAAGPKLTQPVKLAEAAGADKAAHLPKPEPGKPASADAPPQVGKVADVLAGGL